MRAQRQHSDTIRNQRADAAFCALASKVKAISESCEQIGENDMGLLIAAQARKFHRANIELRELSFWLQQVVTEIERGR